MERRLFQLLVVGGAVVALTALAVWLQPEPLPPEESDIRTFALLDKMLARTRFADLSFLPSFWLSSGVVHCADGALWDTLFFALVLLSHSLFWGFLVITQLGSQFYDAASAVQSRGSVFGHWHWFRDWRQHRKHWARRRGPLEILFGLGNLLPGDVCAMVVKDVRTFWRDTTQWGQTIVLFGLLGVYILNLRHFSAQLNNPFWIHLVSYLNLGACALNLATLTTRFVYPQFSLEGKRVWMLGLAPLGLPRILLVKFWMSTLGSLAITLGLIVLSCRMLQLPAARVAFFAGAITCMTFALNGLAVGLGALYPNFKEDNPSKIVSGFGGTFCLVASFLYIVASVVLLALGSPWTRYGEPSGSGVVLSWGAFGLLSVLVGGLPLRLSLRRVVQFEL
jgi:ABC-2 type transport system permease protein